MVYTGLLWLPQTQLLDLFVFLLWPHPNQEYMSWKSTKPSNQSKEGQANNYLSVPILSCNTVDYMLFDQNVYFHSPQYVDKNNFLKKRKNYIYAAFEYY